MKRDMDHLEYANFHEGRSLLPTQSRRVEGQKDFRSSRVESGAVWKHHIERIHRKTLLAALHRANEEERE